jgi:citrate synthase
MSDQDWLRTGIGHSDADSITVMGRDMATELLGRVTFTELAFLLVQRRMPDAGEARLLDAVLVSLADHGLTPTVLAARLTYTGAPESLQGAIASGLLGGGSVFLGVVEDTAVFLEHALAEGIDAEEAVRRRRESGARVPGLGHPVHKVQDPRTPVLYAIAEEVGHLGPHLRLLQQVADANREASGRDLPINGAGVAGAALADLGFPPALLRGFALLARTAGLLGHLAEEMEHPLGMEIYREIDARATYDPPGS